MIPVRIYGGEREEKERSLPDTGGEIKRLSSLEARAGLLSAGPYDAVPAKVSVSAVKQAKSIRHFLTPVLPDEEEEITGARLGTLVHSMMERAVFSEGTIEEAAQDMLARKLLTQREYEAVMSHEEWIRGFLETPLCARIKQAKRVLREQPFNLEVEAGSIGYAGVEKMLVQGILDLAFLEDAWVLVDYKTDRVTEKTVCETAQGYSVQLELYARALHEITGIPVKEKYLYFLRLQKYMQL
nr:PD-(D/E)XK nuclease family protein [Christensenella tenuis]